MAARPGGGLFVLANAFSKNSTTRNLLSTSSVQRGRLAGKQLSGGANTPYKLYFDGEGDLSGDDTKGGSFLAPELSYDGKRILFAYVECSGDRRYRSHNEPTHGDWPEGRAYHIFEVNLDGSKLRQLTDGSWNDFSPCYLPNGRIAFISERRGGYLGSLVVVDPEAADDDGMGPVKRLTPEVGFPETQAGAETYGTAWPLSENYFICAYDVRMPPGNHVGKHEIASVARKRALQREAHR